MIIGFFNAISEKKRDTPKCRKTDQSVDDPAYKCRLTSEDPCYDVEAKQTERSPIDTADDQKKECYSIKNHNRRLCLSWVVFPISYLCMMLDTGSYSIPEAFCFMQSGCCLRIFQSAYTVKCFDDQSRLGKISCEQFGVSSFISV